MSQTHLVVLPLGSSFADATRELCYHCKLLNQVSQGPVLQVWHAASAVASDFQDVDRLVAHNLRRVQNAMRNARLGPHHFAGSSGYGHGDLGRSALDEVCCTNLTASPLQLPNGRIAGSRGYHYAYPAVSTGKEHWKLS